jgi:hypothetical protein
VKAVYVLFWIDGVNDEFLRDVRRERELHENAVNLLIGVFILLS